ncbi:MAG: polysaccharide biosynthesis protein [Oscillospiraceae bacterium]|nr:polysaccharide biosynthesis protein [Oscillospiraceae bacterium]
MSNKKQNFLHGAALLALAVAIVKVIGAIYKIPLKAIIGDVGYSYFNTAYDIYTLLLTISTAGLPIAMSRMISQAHSLGQYNRVRQIYKVSRTLYLGLGLVCTLVMSLLCGFLAEAMGQPGAWTCILALSPCALLMGFLSAYRGFFQGQGNMAPTSESQVLEAFCKLVVGLSLAYAAMKLTQSVSYAAAGAIFGVSVSCLVSALFLYGKFRPAYRELPVSMEEVETFQKTTGRLLSIAVPITIGSAGLQLLNVLEIGIYMDRLEQLLKTGQYQGQLIDLLEQEVQALPEYAADKQYSLMASSLKGIYNFAYTIFNMPCSFIIPINTSVLPAITACLTLNDHNGVRATEESAARITGLLSLPCAVGLAVLAGPVMGLLGGYSGEKLALATQLMAVLGCAVFLYAFVMYTNVLLQSHSMAHVPVINTLICGVIKLGTMYILTGNPNVGILGVPVCSVLCYLFIAVLNLAVISRKVPQKPRLLRNLLRPFMPAALMGVAVYGVYFALTNFMHISSNLLLCAVPILTGVVVYVLLIPVFRVITKEDCLLLPKGEKLAKLLKL